jgi:alanyl-tRNA synthetase
VARLLSASSDQVPALVAAQLEALQSAEKARRRFTAEVVRYQGRELYRTTPPGPDGFRRVVRRLPSGAIDEELRGLAQGFTSQPRAVFVAAIEGTPCSVLFAVSENAGIHAGDVLRQVVARHGGRGGGAAGVAQGSVPSAQALDPLCDELSGGAGLST